MNLPPNQQLAAANKWPVVGEKAPRPDSTPWSVSVRGLVARPRRWTLAELLVLPHVERVIDVHCVTRWSKPEMSFEGVPLTVLLAECGPLPEARFVSFVARSERRHSTSLPLAEALRLDVLVAFSAGGCPLEEIHGGPVRTVVPGRYFYKSLKWLETVELLADDRLGYWEAEAGYHNGADPWKEQRYILSRLDRREVRELLDRRDFSGRDLLGLDAQGLDLSDLNARNTLLRDSHFERTNLEGACFDGANLSNAHLEGARLSGASFRGADVEGANFRQADLRGADFTGASLFGATFCPEQQGETWGPAVLDGTTRIAREAIDTLTPVQQSFVRSTLSGTERA
jgi:DMSO/TMAO reductase YedYZ molybdopterin-dependent catalytic subunit